MGFFGNLFGGNRETIYVPGIPCAFQQALLRSAVLSLRSAGWTNVSESEFPVLKDDRGFLDDLIKITRENEMFAQLKSSNMELFSNTVAGIFLLAGIYVVFCARIFQKPLYTNYSEVMRRFKQCGPLECVMNFLRPAQGPHWRTSFDDVVYGILNELNGGPMEEKVLQLDDDKNLVSFCKAFYVAGNAIGFYYI